MKDGPLSHRGAGSCGALVTAMSRGTPSSFGGDNVTSQGVPPAWKREAS